MDFVEVSRQGRSRRTPAVLQRLDVLLRDDAAGEKPRISAAPCSLSKPGQPRAAGAVVSAGQEWRSPQPRPTSSLHGRRGDLLGGLPQNRSKSPHIPRPRRRPAPTIFAPPVRAHPGPGLGDQDAKPRRSFMGGDCSRGPRQAPHYPRRALVEIDDQVPYVGTG